MKLFNRGRNRHGQLGHGNRNYEYKSKKVEALAGEVIVDVACGARYTLAVTNGKCVVFIYCLPPSPTGKSFFLPSAAAYATKNQCRRSTPTKAFYLDGPCCCNEDSNRYLYHFACDYYRSY